MPSRKFNSQISERTHYFRGLRILVGGTKQVENEKLNREIDTEGFRRHWNSMIWLELQAWQNGNSVSEHDRWLVDARQKIIPKVVDQINHFYFKSDSEITLFSDEVDLLCVDRIEKPCKPKHFLNNSLSDLSKCYFNNYFNAFQQVYKLLKDVSGVEQLFSSSKNFAADFPDYAGHSFQEKIELLCTWYNTSFELLHNFSSIMEMLGFEEYKWLILSFTSSSEVSDDDSEGRSESEVNGDFEKIDCEVRFAEAITNMTESYLRKHKVQNILSLLLSKHLGCLLRAHEMLSHTHVCSGTSSQENNDTKEMSNLLNFVKEALPNFQCNVTLLQKTPFAGRYGLPDTKPLYDFIQSFIFTIMDECLTLRLDQAQECRKQCGSTTSLLTVQQVVTECKEVIHCSLLTLRVHFALHLPDCLCIKNNPHCQLKLEFKSNLMRMFHTYLDFIRLSVTALLTGLPHAPRNFTDTLHSELHFAKDTSAEVDISSCIPCSCKFVTICEQMFLTSADFLETASGAIFLSKTSTDDQFIEDDDLPDDAMLHKATFFWQPAPKIATPTSPQAGVLWFHRQRSESPHFARHHSISLSKSSNPPILHFTKSAPALLINNESESHRRYLFELCRAVRDLFEEVHERSVHAISFAKTLRRHMESAMEFRFVDTSNLPRKQSKKVLCRKCNFFQRAKEAGFVKVNVNSGSSPTSFPPGNYSLFTTDNLFTSKQNTSRHSTVFNVVKRLVSCCTLLPSNSDQDFPNSALLFVKNFDSNKSCSSPTHNNTNKRDGSIPHHCSGWEGEVVWLKNDEIEELGSWEDLSKNLLLTSDLTAVTQNGVDLGRKRKELIRAFHGIIEVEVAQSSVLTGVRTSFDQLHSAILSFSKILVHQINTMARHLQKQVLQEKCYEIEDVEQLFTEINRVVQKNFNIGFEHLSEAIKLLSGSVRHDLEEIQLSCVEMWMQYVIDWLPPGKGFRPRWASIGLNFLANLNVELIKTLSDEKYKQVKDLINKFSDHLVGRKPANKETLPVLTEEPPVYRSLSSHSSRDDNTSSEKGDCFVCFEALQRPGCKKENKGPVEHIRIAIDQMEKHIDQRRMDVGMIGRIVDCPSNSSLVQLTIRSVSFQWQRGHKIGEGSFGRVYTCVNMNTGNILAMKEISFQPHDERHIKQALDEITNFEGISHPNLVKYYGVELHRDQMFIFMDYCDAGTLEEVSRIGLPEVMIQQYTAQLATAVSVLHDQGFVHRDIKGSNIFLTSRGLLKLGDFGSAVRLLNRSKTIAGEIASHHGITAAYTAPEVINNVENRGYGRAADIWSVGCVVIEMATGKRPWHDHEPFQIFYKVGMGSKPAIPNNLGHEGRSFVEKCLEVDPNRRWNIHSLQDHPFVKVSLQVET